MHEVNSNCELNLCCADHISNILSICQENTKTAKGLVRRSKIIHSSPKLGNNILKFNVRFRTRDIARIVSYMAQRKPS